MVKDQIINSLRKIYLATILLVIGINISYCQKFTIEKTSIPNPFSANKIFKVFTDKYGKIFLSTENGVFNWDGNSITDISAMKDFSDYSAFNIWQDKKGLVWFNTFSEKMICFDKDQVVASPFNSILQKHKIDASVQDVNGNYWFGDRYGNIIFINKSGKAKINTNPSRERIHRIHRIEPLKNGQVLAALTYGSFYLLNSQGDIVKKMDWKHDYNWGPANMFCLKNGKTIFCNNEGIHLYTKNLILEKMIPFDADFNGYISDIKEDKNGLLWIGSKIGLYSLTPDFKRKSLRCILKNTYVNSISLGIEDIVWVATNNTGLLKIKNTDLKSVKRDESAENYLLKINADTLKRYNITAVYFDKSNSEIWWAANHFLGKIKNNTYSTFNCKELVVFSPKSITKDTSGNIWVGGDGLKVFNTRTGELHTIPELENAIVKDIKFIKPYIFVATINKGIFILSDTKVINKLNSENYLYSNNCSKIIPDGNYLNFAVERRIFRFKFNGFQPSGVRVIAHQFEKIDIDSIADSGNYFRCFSKDSVYSVLKQKFIYPIEISFISKGKSLDPYVNNQIEYKNNETGIRFSGATYENQDLLSFRYKLMRDGNNADWIFTRLNKVNFVYLEPGSYRFMLQKSFDKFNWTQCKPIHFEIIPPFWKTLWFKFLIGLIALLILTYFFYERLSTEKSKRVTAEIKLKALQSQMNPHFIFNSLNSIQQFIFNHDVVKSNHYLTLFSNLMRKCYEYASLEFITIGDEIKFLEDYLEIETLRFEEKFKFEIKCASEISLDSKIPPLLIQPIVENAIKHGFKKLKDGGFISVIFKKSDSLLEVIVQDNGIGFEPENYENKSGSLQQTRDRILLLKKAYHNKMIDLKYHSKPEHGTTAFLYIPILK